jgi:nickel/cobalt transporter (NicO) family protein
VKFNHDPRNRPPLRRPSCLFAVLLFLLSSHPLRAHNPPEEYYGRNTSITIEPGGVQVIYRLELSSLSLFRLPQNDKAIQIGPVKTRAGLETACLERMKVLVPDKLLGFFSGRPLHWKLERATASEAMDGATNFQIRLRADWQLKAGENSFDVEDGNFSDDPGPYAMKIDFGDGIDVQSFVPPRIWAEKGVDPDKDKNRKASVVFRISDQPQQLPPPEAVEESPPAPQPEPTIWQELRTFWQRIRDDNLDYLLQSKYALWLLIVIAFIHGAGHSLMPGHGKTAVAAYLVGERGTPWHAVLLGVVTTLTHTSAAIIVALLLQFTLPRGSETTVNKVLMFGCGMMMLVVGVWLFLQRLAGRSDHVHLVDVGHGHSHGGAPAPIARAGVVRLVLLGIAGGIIPCWGAIMWVVGCIATSQFWLALPIVLSFSVGLASVLVCIGLSVVYAGRIGQSRWGQRRWFKLVFNERAMRIMPIVGAALIVAIGLFFCVTSGIGAK